MAQFINLNVFKVFFKSSNAGGILLFICVILSLIIANTSMSASLQNLLDYKIGYESESIHLNYSILLWINDGLMAIFFLLVGLEIKREIVEGELSSPKKASLPILCAIGGAVVPAIIYLSLNAGKDTSTGWGIPMATDIAFALAVINLLGNKIPSSLKIFLAALAIVDDLIAILVIALFYSSGIDVTYLMYAGAGLAILIAMNRMNIQNPYLYLIPGVFIWYFVHHSGIHATIAGVLVAMTIPTNDTAVESPLERLEHALVKPVNFFIIPLFAFANTNITLESNMINGLTNSLGLGIAIFVFTLFVIILIGKTLSKAVTWTGVGSIDKVFGLLFGFFKGYVVSICLFSIFNWFYPYQNWGISAEDAISFNLLNKGSEILIDEFPSSEDLIDTKEKIENI